VRAQSHALVEYARARGYTEEVPRLYYVSAVSARHASLRGVACGRSLIDGVPPSTVMNRGKELSKTMRREDRLGRQAGQLSDLASMLYKPR